MLMTEYDNAMYTEYDYKENVRGWREINVYGNYYLDKEEGLVLNKMKFARRMLTITMSDEFQ